MKMLADFDKEGFKKEVITNVKTLFPQAYRGGYSTAGIPGSQLRSKGRHH